MRCVWQQATRSKSNRSRGSESENLENSEPVSDLRHSEMLTLHTTGTCVSLIIRPLNTVTECETGKILLILRLQNEQYYHLLRHASATVNDSDP
jgi:hypothetical protein